MIKGNNYYIKTPAAAEFLGVHPDTLRNWDKSGYFKPLRTPGGTRLYSVKRLRKLGQMRNLPKEVFDFNGEIRRTRYINVFGVFSIRLPIFTSFTRVIRPRKQKKGGGER